MLDRFRMSPPPLLRTIPVELATLMSLIAAPPDVVPQMKLKPAKALPPFARANTNTAHGPAVLR